MRYSGCELAQMKLLDLKSAVGLVKVMGLKQRLLKLCR